MKDLLMKLEEQENSKQIKSQPLLLIGVETVCEVVDCCTHCCAHIVVALLQLVTALRPSYIRTDSRTMRTRASSITLCFPRTRFARPIPCDHERSYFQLSPSLHTCPQPARYGIYNSR